MSRTAIIADDADFMRAMLKEILCEMGFEVVGEAADGKTAVELTRRHRPDLVALDITMPGLDGVAALRGILADDPTARVIMITALGQREQVLESIQIGASDFVVKPFDQERVKATVERVLARAPAPA